MLWRLLSFTHLWIALGAFVTTMFSWMWWAEGAAMERGGVEVAFWVATATGLGYTVQRAIKHTRHPHNMPEGRRRFWDVAKWPMVAAWGLAWSGCTWVHWGELGLEDPGRVAVLGVVAAASLAYAVVPGLGGGLRKIVWVKTPLIAAVWATATTHHPELGWDGVLWIQRFVFIAGLTLPFDIRDLDVDKDHMETLPLGHVPGASPCVVPAPAGRRRALEPGRVGLATRPAWGPPHRRRTDVARPSKWVGHVVDSAQGGPECLGEFRRMDARAQDGLAARRRACDALRRGPDVVRRALDAGARDVRLNPRRFEICHTFTVNQQAMILTRFSFAVPMMGFFAMLLLAGLPNAHAQWLEWDLQTDSRLVLSSVAQSDDEEKDMWPADLNKDGWTDVIVVRKEPFSAATEPAKSDLLLMNQEGTLVDMTAELAPEFLTNVSFARDVYTVDVDGDTWDDVVIINTFNQQAHAVHEPRPRRRRDMAGSGGRIGRAVP